MALKRILPRAASPITLALAKQHCRVTHSDDDAIINLYIQAAGDHIEGNRGVLGRALVNQSWELTYDAFPSGALEIPLGPLASVTSIEYAHPDTGIMTTMNAANYMVDTASWQGWVSPVDVWPDTRETLNAVKITFVAGHGATADDVPADIKMAMLHLISHWYENREAVDIGNVTSSIPLTFDTLIGAVRKITV